MIHRTTDNDLITLAFRQQIYDLSLCLTRDTGWKSSLESRYHVYFPCYMIYVLSSLQAPRQRDRKGEQIKWGRELYLGEYALFIHIHRTSWTYKFWRENQELLKWRWELFVFLEKLFSLPFTHELPYIFCDCKMKRGCCFTWKLIKLCCIGFV